MKLLVVSAYFDSHRGGVEVVAGELARRFAAEGHETVWAAADASPPPAAGEKLTPAPLPCLNAVERRTGVPFPIPGPRALARLVRAVRAAEAVLIHDALYVPNVAAFLAAKAMRRPVLITQHIGLVPYRNPLLRALMALGDRLVARPLLAGADRVVFISDVTARHFASVRFRRPPRLVFNGVSPVFAPGRVDRKRIGLSRRPVALFVGRFVEKKGLAYLEAAARMRPDVDFAFAGWGPLDPAAWGLPNVTVFAGRSGEALAELYRAADVLVLPSAGEGFPLVVQEALACGLAVVCGAETLKADPEAAPLLYGVAITPEEPDAVAARISEGIDAALAGPARSKARRAAFARARYSWEAAAAAHLEFVGAQSSAGLRTSDQAATAASSSPGMAAAMAVVAV